MQPLRKISILANGSKLGAEQAADRLRKLAEDHGVEAVSTVDFPAPKGFIEGSDACFVVGGDGTLLNVMEEAVRHDVPVAGIRHGQLGFLATFSPEDMEAKISQLKQDDLAPCESLGQCCTLRQSENREKQIAEEILKQQQTHEHEVQNHNNKSCILVYLKIFK